MRHFATLAIATSLLLGSGAAQAQDIRWKFETMTPGDYVSIDQSNGGLIHHVFSGQSGGTYVIHSFRGRTPGGTPVFTTYADGDGNWLRFVDSEGNEWRYSPHDCTRTIGRCQYTQINPDGSREVRLRITEATRNGYSFQEYDASGQRLLSGRNELDERGTAGDGRLNGPMGEQRFRLVHHIYQ